MPIDPKIALAARAPDISAAGALRPISGLLRIQRGLDRVARDHAFMSNGVQNLKPSQRNELGNGLGVLASQPNVTSHDVMDWAAQYSAKNPAAAPALITGLKYLPQDAAQLPQWLTAMGKVVQTMPDAAPGDTAA